MHSKKYEPPDLRKASSFQTREDALAKKTCQWKSLEIYGKVLTVSNEVFGMNHLTSLHMANNRISHLPSCVGNLRSLEFLDLSNNVLEDLPKEIGDLLNLRELHLRHNQLRELPFEVGRLFQLSKLSIEGNPFNQEYPSAHPSDPQPILLYLLDNLQGELFTQYPIHVGVFNFGM